jgi:hypothetical protein
MSSILKLCRAVLSIAFFFGVLSATLVCSANESQDGVWTWVPAGQALKQQDRAIVQPYALTAVNFNRTTWDEAAITVERETVETVGNPVQEIVLPAPYGQYARFRIIESPVMAPELAVRYPSIKTYRGVGVDDPDATVRLSVTPHGLHAQVLSPQGAWYVDPQQVGADQLHMSYYKRDAGKVNAELGRQDEDGQKFECLTTEEEVPFRLVSLAD